MKKMTMISILALCLLFLVFPVIADKEGQGIHAGVTVGAAGNSNGQTHDEKGGTAGGEGNHTPAAPANEMSRGDQRNAERGSQDNSTGMQRTVSQIPGLKNQSSEDHGASVRNTGTIPPGWERNPNEVRDAVRLLLAMENRTGGIGPQVSAIAREFSNSENTSQQYRDRIKNRDAFSKIFFGGDRQAAAELANLTAQNQARILEIENLMNTSTLDTDTRTQMDQQMLILRLQLIQEQQLTAQVQQDRGLFGWF